MRALLHGGPLGGQVRDVGLNPPIELVLDGEASDLLPVGEGRAYLPTKIVRHRYVRDPTRDIANDVEVDVTYGYAGMVRE